MEEYYKNKDKHNQKNMENYPPQSFQLSKEVLNIQKVISQQPSNQSSFFRMLMDDPTLREVSQNLQRQAQENKRQQLMASFTHRYQKLLELQLEYQQLKCQLNNKQKQLTNQQNNQKEIQQIHQKEKKMLKLEIQSREQQNRKQAQKHLQDLQARDQIYYRSVEKCTAIQKQRDKYLQKIEKLERKSHQCQEQNQQYKWKIENLKKEILQINRNNEIANISTTGENQTMKNTIKSLQLTIASLKSQLESKQTHLLQTLKQKQEEIVQLIKKNRQYQIQKNNSIEQFQEAILEKDNQINLIKDKYLENIKDISNLQQQFDIVQSELSRQRQQHLLFSERYRNEKQEWNKKIQFYQSLKQDLQNIQLQSQSNIKTHQYYNQELMLQNKSNIQKFNTLEHEHNLLTDRYYILERQYQHLKNIYQKLNLEYSKLIQNSGNSFSDLHLIIQNIKFQLAQTLEQKKLLNDKIIILDRQRQQLKQEIKSIRSQNFQFKQIVQKLTKQKKQFQQTFNQKKKHFNILMIQIGQYQKQMVSKLNYRQKQLQHLKNLTIQIKESKPQFFEKQTQIREQISEQCIKIQCHDIRNEHKKYQQTIEKMKLQMLELCKNVQQKSSRERQLFEQLIRENRILKSKKNEVM